MTDDRERKSIVAGAPGAAGQVDEEALRASRVEEDESVLTLVCLTCGQEYFFTDQAPEGGLSCEKCGNKVFRDFHSASGDEAARDFRESTERDLDSDDAEGDTRPGDLIDLNRD
jgi:transcription initiation factor IIE alpha subunit